MQGCTLLYAIAETVNQWRSRRLRQFEYYHQGLLKDTGTKVNVIIMNNRVGSLSVKQYAGINT